LTLVTISPASQLGKTWVLRPLVWFPASYTILIIVHEMAHALMGVALGFPSTLFNFWVNHDFTGATIAERAAVGAAGPCVGLVVGLLCWALYRANTRSAYGFPLLLLAGHGGSNLLGNMMSAAFVGDFSNAALMFRLPMAARYAVSLLGLVGVTIAPALLGTVFVVILNEPTPMGASFMSARLTEAALWVFATAGVLTAPPRQQDEADRPLRFHPADAVALIVAGVVVKLMSRGILLTPVAACLLALPDDESLQAAATTTRGLPRRPPHRGCVPLGRGRGSDCCRRADQRLPVGRAGRGGAGGGGGRRQHRNAGASDHHQQRRG